MTAMLTEPSALTSANYVLAGGSAFYARRTGKVRAIVMHVTAGLQDLGMSGSDESAEGTNRWALNSAARVSWHRIADSDGVERCLPSTATAWHAKGYNSNTVGIEISNVDARWDNKPEAWVKATVWNAARAAADWVVRYKVPIRRATQAELDRSIATGGGPVGFIDHSRLSDNRIDPGASFPWALFFQYVRAIIAGAPNPSEEDTLPSVSEVWTTDLTKTGRIGGNPVNESPLEILTRVARNIEFIAGLVKAQDGAADIAAEVAKVLPQGTPLDEAALSRAFVTALTELASRGAPEEAPAP
jgi:hypothetical protein